MQTRSEQARAKDREQELALSRGVLYAALSLGFRPPTAETIERLTDREAVGALTEAALRLQAVSSAAGSDLARRVRAIARANVALDELAAAYLRLFGHTARGEVPAYETEYGAEALFQQPQELGDLSGFAGAFGLALRTDAHERIDHVSCECEFVSFLAWKEAYALEVDDEEMRRATVGATALFLRDHLGRFAPVFARRLARVDGEGFYAALGQFLLVLVETDCRRLGIELGPETLGLRPDPAACSAPMGCETSCGAPAEGP
jgi:DMSO reductase family type II enzyme chaperone